MREILDYCTGGVARAVSAGTLLIDEGSKTGHLFVLIEGQLEVIKGDTVVACVAEPGAVVGEMSVLLDQPHTATVRAASDSTIYEFADAASFLRDHPAVALSIARLLARRLNVATTYLADGMDVSHAPPELQAKAAEVFPRAKATVSKAIAKGARIACGTDAPAIPHGKNAKELVALVDRGMSPLEALRAATTVAAELIDVDDRGRLEPGLLADIIAVPGDPLVTIGVTEDVRFVMKGGQVYRHDGA